MSENEKTEELEVDQEKDDVKADEIKPTKKSGGSKAGVIYLSRIPTKMNVKIIREYMSQYGEVGRIYLEPREKKRKNQPRSFKEGWVEFKKKKIAKLAVKELNNTQVGGKRRNPWYSELWNMKYLKKFRWTHLNERIAYEQEIRKQRLRQEITLAKKEANFYIQNVEKNEKRKRFESKRQNETRDEDHVERDREDDASHGAKTNKDAYDTSNESELGRPKHPLFERKTKIAGNDSFLKQIFS